MQDLRRILEESRVVAVLGAHPQRMRAAFYVPAYLQSRGYEIWPVNATRAGEQLFGRTVLASLAEVPVPVDLVDVFRRSDALPGHLAEILAMAPLPKVVWFQQGIVNEAVAEQLRAHGISVVQDRCTLADHRALGL